jgi:hypothetical protein
MTIDGSIETILDKTFRSNIGFSMFIIVEMSTIEPAMRVGCHWCLFLGKSTFFILLTP